MIRVITIKKCPICLQTFQRPSGKSDKVWEKQMCCGANCAAIYRRKETTKKVNRKDLIPGEKRYQGWRKK